MSDVFKCCSGAGVINFIASSVDLDRAAITFFKILKPRRLCANSANKVLKYCSIEPSNGNIKEKSSSATVDKIKNASINKLTKQLKIHGFIKIMETP